jgi:outer membrane protein
VLAAQDNLEFAEAERKAIARELDQAKQRFEVGLIAITGVHEAQARYDQSRADEIVARNGLDNAWEALREIVGPEAPTSLARLAAEVPLDPPAPAAIDEWSGTALQNNPGVQAAIEAAEVARQEIEVQRSGYYPSVDLIGSYEMNRWDTSRAVESNTASVGVQLAMPLYTGGGVAAATRQAQANFQAAQDVLDQQRRAVDKEVRNAYRGVEASIEAVKAFGAATVSAESALEATTAGFEVGTRTQVDVLNSQSDLFDAKRNHAAARYVYVINLLRLEQAAGTLDVEDLQRVNAWLE